MAEQAQNQSAEPAEKKTSNPPEQAQPGRARYATRRVVDWLRSRKAKKDPDLIEVSHNMKGVGIPFRFVCKHPAWYRFLVVMLFIGGASTLGWLIKGGYEVGRASVSHVQPAPTNQLETERAIKELRSAIEKLAESKQAVAPASAAATTALPPQPIVVKVEIPAMSTPTVQPKVEPPPVITDAERRNLALEERLRRQYGIR